MKAKKIILLAISLPPPIVALLYGGGVIAQFISGYLTWQNGGGTPGDGTSPPLPTLDFLPCIGSAFSFSYGLAGILICLVAIAALVFFMRLNSGNGGAYDKERNFNYSDKGTYGTSGFMTEREVKEVLDLTNDLRKHTGTVLGLLDGQFVCVPKETRLNANMAVYGASGSMKTRSFCVNRILQSAARGESLIVCDPKSELYEKTSEYMRDKGYTVKVFNLVSPQNSDSWNCLAEIEGDELMAQLFCDVVIKNTGSERGDHFWDAAEQNLMKALVLYVDLGYPPEKRNIGEVYKLLTLDYYSVGDSLVVRITAVDVQDVDNIKVTAAVRSDIDSARDKLKLCRIQGKYSGKVIGVYRGMCFIRLTNGVNAVAHSCRDSRYPGKKDDVSFIVTKINEEHGTAVGIISRIIKQNL